MGADVERPLGGGVGGEAAPSFLQPGAAACGRFWKCRGRDTRFICKAWHGAKCDIGRFGHDQAVVVPLHLVSLNKDAADELLEMVNPGEYLDR
jgi:hypothetical protein